MHFRSILVFSILFIASAVASPVPVEHETTRKMPENATEVAQDTEIPNEDLIDKNNEYDKKTKDCTLRAFQVIISPKHGRLDEDCQEILRQLIKSKAETADQIDGQDDIDLREELKQLADVENRYEKMKNEIEKEQNTLPDEISSNNKEIQTLEKMDDIKDSEAGKNSLQQKIKSATLYGDGFSLGKSDVNGGDSTGFSPARFSSERKDPSGETLLDTMEDDTFSRNNDGIGPERKPQETIEEEFLVLPLRYLKAQLHSNYPKESKASMEQENLENKHPIIDDEKALNWAMRSILDRINVGNGEQEFLPSFPKEDNANSLGVFTQNESKTSAHETLSRFSDGKSPKTLGAQPEADENQSIEKTDFDHQRDYEETRQRNMKVLSEVEDEISKLGDELRRLETINKI